MEESIDWEKCVICQDTTKESLKCPLKSNGTPEANRQTYASFLENVRSFRQLNALPVDIHFGEDVDVECLCRNNGSWHKTCHLKFSASKVKKAQERVDRKRKSEDEVPAPTYTITKRRASNQADLRCLFCREEDVIENLHRFSYLETDRRIREMALELQDYELLGRMSGGDLIATEAKYHLDCITTFRNRYRSLVTKKTETSDGVNNEKMDESVAFVELTEYIEGCSESGSHLFKLTDLTSLYVQRLENLGINKTINKTRLKNALLEHFKGSLQEQTDGRHTVLVFREGISDLLKDALKRRDFSEDAEILAKAARIVRKDMFLNEGFNFRGCFPMNCQSKNLTSSLRSLVSMIINGLDIKDHSIPETQACLTICETIIFNSKKRACKTKTGQTRHSASREPPLPLYVGLSVHSSTRSKTLIEKLYSLGVSVSYDRVMEIEDALATSLCERFSEDGIVSPACLRKGLFSVGALDNIDHNPSSTTSVSSFHGTGISIFQFPTESVPGETRPPLAFPPSGTVQQLPESYATVPAVALNTTSVSVAACNMTAMGRNISLDEAKEGEGRWVSHALVQLDKDVVRAEDTITWAGYHSNNLPQENVHPAICTLLPLFYEKADTPAMIKHGMDVISQVTTFLNPGQVPVITVDQPLFALAKFIQWKWPAVYGEEKFVVMFGGLHLEMGMWNTLGDLLDGSGWTGILTEADVASSGIANSLLKASHLTRTR